MKNEFDPAEFSKNQGPGSWQIEEVKNWKAGRLMAKIFLHENQDRLSKVNEILGFESSNGVINANMSSVQCSRPWLVVWYR